MTTDGWLVDQVAAQMYAQKGSCPWEKLGKSSKDWYRRLAEPAISAIRSGEEISSVEIELIAREMCAAVAVRSWERLTGSYQTWYRRLAHEALAKAQRIDQAER